MIQTRGITFKDEAQRKAYIADCRADQRRNSEPLEALGEGFLKHDRTLVGRTIYLPPALKGFRLSRDGSTVTDERV